MAGLYLHIPFCGSACPYCDFAFVVDREDESERYVDALQRELASRASGAFSPCETVYFGGGTPSSLAPEQVERLLKCVDRHLGIAPGAEITLEADPLHADRFGGYRKAGVTRLSLGIQALTSDALRALGRRHTVDQATTSFAAARRAGFENLNVDVIFGAPDQSAAAWAETLDRTVDLAPQHLSIYGLTIERSTPFGRRHARGTLPVPNEEAQATMFAYAQTSLERAGYLHYEISNYALPGLESRHNHACWRGASYLGLGVSAHSYDGDRRVWNTIDLNGYLTRIESGDLAIEGSEALTPEQKRLERVMLGLRTADGIEIALVAGASVDRLVGQDVLERVDGYVKLTERGRLVADAVCSELVGAA